MLAYTDEPTVEFCENLDSENDTRNRSILARVERKKLSILSILARPHV